MKDIIFALDIGTRSVNGLLLNVSEDTYTLIDYESVEHTERSMLDGQIHDVVAVSKIIHKVKERLEGRHDITLTKVCVAAAGRALKTRRTIVSTDIEKQPLMDREAISFLELSAVQKAQYELAEEEKDQDQLTHYYCVGYSVLQYKLDDDIIGSLIDQQGAMAEVEIIATFLPKVVVESLVSALNRADLDMEALTLEPIAAINVLIPESMRRLNVALVDIGAGTSDIALTDAGTITAYGMVSKAGDEITEAISDHYLLDFNEAERVKREITEHGEATLQDILGFETVVTKKELAMDIKEAIDDLATAIATEVMTLNKRAPKAVMLVGGGSLTPMLTHVLAEKLELPVNRVATRGTDAIKNLQTAIDVPQGPEFITPIGIAIAAKQNPVHYISVTVNDRAVRLFDMKQLTVGDCLLAAGIQIKKMYGRPGMAYMISVNNQTITLPGTHGTPPKLQLNGENIHVDALIQHNDTMLVEKGDDGQEPNVTLFDVVGDIQPFNIYFNDQPYDVLPIIKVNDKPTTLDHLLKDGDRVELIDQIDLETWLNQSEFHYLAHEPETFAVYLDDTFIPFEAVSERLLINNKPATLKTKLKPQDKISYSPLQKVTKEKLGDLLNLDLTEHITVTFNGETVTIEKAKRALYHHDRQIQDDDIIEPLSKLTLKPLPDTTFVFQDVFRYVHFDLMKQRGHVSILKNNTPTTFLEPIQDGDALEIKYESKSSHT